jgi:hypothetical protein
VRGPGSTPPLHLLHSLRADGRLERKESELPGLLLGPACTPSFNVGKEGCWRLLRTALPTRWRARGGAREQNQCGRRLSLRRSTICEEIGGGKSTMMRLLRQEQ